MHQRLAYISDVWSVNLVSYHNVKVERKLSKAKKWILHLITWVLCEIRESLIKKKWIQSQDIRKFFSYIYLCLISSTNQMCEIHVQSPAVAEVGVHPTAMQHHLRHALLDHLVILRPAGSNRHKVQQSDKPHKDMSDTNSAGLIKHKWFPDPR